MNIDEINLEIERLEASQTNYENCSKLSILYIIRQNMAQPKITEYIDPSTEFLSAVNGAPIKEVLYIIDEHLECIRLLYPKEYSAIINKINNI